MTNLTALASECWCAGLEMVLMWHEIQDFFHSIDDTWKKRLSCLEIGLGCVAEDA